MLLSLLSCNTTKSTENEEEAFAPFESEVTEDWQGGIEALRKDPRANYLKNIIELYLSRRYAPVQKELEELILDYLIKFDVELDILFESVKNRDEVQSAIEVAKGLERENKIDFVIAIYLSEPSEIRNFEIEAIGKNLIDETYLDSIYEYRSKAVKLGLIASAAYMKGDGVKEWLLEKIFSDDEEISSAALFSLSKHGSPGFLLIADNLVDFSTRIQLVAIDLLSFNKVVRAYPYFAELLADPDPLITQRVFNAYKGFGKKNDLYIFDALRKAHPSLTLEILEIIEGKMDEDYLNVVGYLLEREELRQTIIDYAYNRRSWNFLSSELSKNNYSTPIIIETGLRRESVFLFVNNYVNYKAVDYLIHNVEFSRVLDYFIALEIDGKYISDYRVIANIDKALSQIADFESQNGITPFVTRYFDLQEKGEEAKENSESFFKGMELWLTTGDNSVLDKNEKVVQLSTGDLKEDREKFLDSLSEEDLNLVLSYEENKLLILSSYRQLTYRLKDYSEILIEERGYSSLIR